VGFRRRGAMGKVSERGTLCIQASCVGKHVQSDKFLIIKYYQDFSVYG
jgi:hypothetical protein